MVKGVNKSVIEVNNTGSEVFEKIVFYVSPKFASLSPKSLQIATNEIENTLLSYYENTQSLRNRVRYKNNRKRMILLALCVLTLVATGFVLFKLVF